MSYRGIVFDKDGTLLDFNRTWLPVYLYAAQEFAAGDGDAARALLADHGYVFEQQRFVGGSLLAAGNNRQIADAWAHQLGIPERIDEFGQRLEQIFRDRGAEEATPVDGLAETMASLKDSGRGLGVATADSYQGIITTLRNFGILQHFDFLAGYDSGHGVKPEAGMVLAFCAQLDIEPAEVVVVGDNRHDIEMGRNAGVGLCVGVLTGTSTRAELATIADAVLDDIGGLPELL